MPNEFESHPDRSGAIGGGGQGSLPKGFSLIFRESKSEALASLRYRLLQFLGFSPVLDVAKALYRQDLSPSQKYFRLNPFYRTNVRSV